MGNYPAKHPPTMVGKNATIRGAGASSIVWLRAPVPFGVNGRRRIVGVCRFAPLASQLVRRLEAEGGRR